MGLMKGDVKFAIIACLLIFVYCCIFLGSCSPVHCRLSLAIVGVLCVFLACSCGEAICYMTGWKYSDFWAVLPILMLGIGVDDMFVICNAIDQTSFDLSPGERIKKGMAHAGPSITITSLTDCIAFFTGSTSSLLAIQSLCIYAGVTVVMLYVCVLTVFLPFVVWDTQRVHKQQKECCGAFFCKDDSAVFCGARFLTSSQKKFSGLTDNDVTKQNDV